MKCPACGGAVRYGARDYHILETADDGIEHFWACDDCCWADSVQQPWVDKGDPSPAGTLLGERSFLVYPRMRKLLEEWIEPPTAEQKKERASLEYQLKSVHRTEGGIRKVVGNYGDRPRPEIEQRFAAVGDS